MCLNRHINHVRFKTPATTAKEVEVSQQRWVVHSGSDFGRAVADIRHIRKLTQTELSSEAGLGRTWLAKLETGRTTLVLEIFLRLLRRLDATVTITIDNPEKHDAAQ